MYRTLEVNLLATAGASVSIHRSISSARIKVEIYVIFRQIFALSATLSASTVGIVAGKGKA